jgi:dihydroorotate dehydrogenase (fumarate)
MEDSGLAAVVLHSLFEEQITLESEQLDYALSSGTESFAEALSYFPDMSTYNMGPEGYLEHINQVKNAVDIPVIASLNGVSSGGWIKYARLIEQAGADALELNIYYLASDPSQTSTDVEEMYITLVREVVSSVQIPVAVKLSPYFSALANFAQRLEQMGARGLVLFNRFYQPDFDLENLTVVPHLQLSSSKELRLRLRWVAILSPQLSLDLAVTGGIHTPEDILKSMMAGARVAMTTSALLKNGIQYAQSILEGLNRWMEEHEYASIAQMQGSMSQKKVLETTALERANYMKVLRSY